MIRTVFASILFTVAALALINFLGDLTLTSSEVPSESQALVEAQVATEPEPAPVGVEETASEVANAEQTTPKEGSGDGNVEKGLKIFRGKCMSCHTIAKGDKNRTGPNLWSIVGRKQGNAENFTYSKTLKMRGGVWSEAEINSFIAGPRSLIPDTKMTFAGLKNAQDRADVIAFLKTQTD